MFREKRDLQRRVMVGRSVSIPPYLPPYGPISTHPEEMNAKRKRISSAFATTAGSVTSSLRRSPPSLPAHIHVRANAPRNKKHVFPPLPLNLSFWGGSPPHLASTRPFYSFRLRAGLLFFSFSLSISAFPFLALPRF